MTEITEPRLTDAMSEKELQDYVVKSHEQLHSEDQELQFALNAVLGHQDQHKGNSIALTAVTPGGTVSGLAITRDEWKDQHYSAFANSSLEKIFTEEEEFLTTLSAKSAQIRSELELPTPPRRYVHLKSATIHNGGVPVSVGYIRVYLKDVSAWSLTDLGGYQG